MRIPVRMPFSRCGWTRCALAAASLFGLGAFGPVSESSAARTACTPSVLRLCPDAALTGDREGAKRCLLKNLQRASTQCQAAVKAISEAKNVARDPS
jgi:hypothetical protein